jgi:glycerol kinase
LEYSLEIMVELDLSGTLASSVENNGGVYFVPAFAGLFAPYWRDDARGFVQPFR